MVLVDSSVWIDHFRRSHPALEQLLVAAEVLSHAAVIGELACGQLRNRRVTIDLLQRLPEAAAASDEEALRLIDDHRLWGRGLGWVDVHLLASARLSGCRLLTLDRRLGEVSRRLRVAYQD